MPQQELQSQATENVRRFPLVCVQAILAAVSLLIVTMNLIVNCLLASWNEAAITRYSYLTARQNEVFDLKNIVGDANVAVNDVFDNRSVDGQERLFDEAIAKLNRSFDDLATYVDAAVHDHHMLEADAIERVRSIRGEIDKLIQFADAVFVEQRRGNLEVAGRRMAQFDRQTVQLSHSIDRLRTSFSQAIEHYLHQQAAGSEKYTRIELLISLLGVGIVGGAAMYGFHLMNVVQKIDASRRSLLDELAMLKTATDEACIVAVTDRRGRIIYVNKLFCDISGFSQEELIGKTHRLVNSGYHDAEFFREMWRTISQGKIWHGDVCNRNKSGALYWVKTTIVPHFNSRGELERFVALRVDITEQKRIERELLESRELVQATINSMDDQIYVLDEAGRLAAFHCPVPKRSLISEPSMHIGSRFASHLAPEVGESLGVAIENIRVGGRVEHFDYSSTIDGEQFWFNASISARHEINGEFTGTTVVARDISKRKKAEEKAREMSLSKSAFLANMSHEIRTPMTAILGFTEFLLQDEEVNSDPLKRNEAIRTIQRNGDHLLTIINDILDLSKIEAGKMEVERINTSPVLIVKEVVSLMQIRATGKNVQLAVTWETNVPAAIESDPVRLRQILLNLVGNAIKFTEAGEVRISVSFTPAGENSEMQFRVTDTGIGMTPEQSAQLFRAFSQGDTSMTRKFGGTGLGLAISSRLAEMMGGGITVESEHGKGSAFTLTICTGGCHGVRLVDACQETKVAPAEDANKPAAKMNEKLLEGRRILMAEDGPDNQRLISYVLRKAGAEVVVVENGQQAVEACTVDGTVVGELATPPKFDVILMDMQMPVMDGYTAAGILRDKGKLTPVIALTAHAMSSDFDRCIAAGCDDFSTKPIDREPLIRKIAAWCQEASRWEALEAAVEA